MMKTLLAAALTVTALAVAGPAAASPPNLCDPQSIDANGMCQFHASGVYDDIDLVFPSDYPEQQKVQDYLNTVVDQYQTTPQIAEALERLTEAYYSLGLNNEAQTAAAVLGKNYPGSPWYQAAYNILRGRNLKPMEDRGSWISQAFRKML